MGVEASQENYSDRIRIFIPERRRENIRPVGIHHHTNHHKFLSTQLTHFMGLVVMRQISRRLKFEKSGRDQKSFSIIPPSDEWI